VLSLELVRAFVLLAHGGERDVNTIDTHRFRPSFVPQ
jgi:hypothetical protein